MSLPQPQALLPDYMQFIGQLRQQIQTGTLDNWQGFSAQVRAFFTPERLYRVDEVVSGWAAMAAHANEQTLIHVTAVLVALYELPEFLTATHDEQQMMIWIVLFHDVAKVPRHGDHDYIHAFRSGAIVGKHLAKLGFPTTPHFEAEGNAWAEMTYHAIVWRDDLQETIQDNRKLGAIIAGINRFYGEASPAASIIKAVLLHLSIVTDPNYPTLAPLTTAEIVLYVTPCFKLLKAMMLVDTAGWDLFDSHQRDHHRQLTLAAFDAIAGLIHAGL